MSAPIAYLSVLSGDQQGVTFLVMPGDVTIGRERGNRVELHDPTVSRRHAIVRSVGDALEIEDLGSANGIALIDEHGERIEPERRMLRVTRSCVIAFGDVCARIDIGPPPGPTTRVETLVPHLQAPVVDPVFAPEPLMLPAPPENREATRFPLLALLSPALAGGAMYLFTQSMMSLVFVAVSPAIMLASWVDGLLARRKTDRAKQQEFEAALRAAKDELAENLPLEQAARTEEAPASLALTELPRDRQSTRLWSRRPEHRAFLEFRLGTATLPARKPIELPARGQIPVEKWEALVEVHDRYREIAHVPLLERLDRCGNFGIAGDPYWAPAAARSVLVQLTALHSPADLVFAAFANDEQAEGDWAWLKWLPHVDSPYSPIVTPHLASDARSSSMLLTALEGLIQGRQEHANTGEVRSRMPGGAEDAGERSTPASKRPHVPAVVVCILAHDHVDRSRLVGLAEDGPDVGVHVIWLAPRLHLVPAACRSVVEAFPDTWRVHFIRRGETVTLSQIETLELPVAAGFGRALAPVVDAGARVLDETDLPRTVTMPQLFRADILGSADGVLQSWSATDSVKSGWVPGAERDPGLLSAAVGQGSAGPLELYLRTHGPHAFVGGTTGSGKSEFLQAWLMSLAARYSPDRVTLLLIDYKGGSAFGEIMRLPHAVGLVTDLDAHTTKRVLKSLRAELRRREELLAEKGAKDLIALERLGDRDCPPVLIIAIDELAAMATEMPWVIDELIDVAQRGRSLGIHLILGTQRPGSVIRDNLRANMNLRIALRMADHADSQDVIGVADAADFSAEVPGRAAVKVGAGRLTHFQSAYLGGRSETDRLYGVSTQVLDVGAPARWVLHPQLPCGGVGWGAAPHRVISKCWCVTSSPLPSGRVWKGRAGRGSTNCPACFRSTLRCSTRPTFGARLDTGVNRGWH